VIHCGANAKPFVASDWMPTTDAITVVLRACDPALNRRRSWAVEAGLDLFGDWTARVSFGRIGGRGRMIWRAFASEESARDFVRKGLRRRRSAVRRCGVAYKVIEASPDVLPLVVEAGLQWEKRRPEH
jgi:predicted DNA-binding WGR domain protein